MDLSRAARDPWVWGQVAVIGAILAGVPLLAGPPAPGPHRLAGLGAALAGGAFSLWGIASLGRSLTPGVHPLPGSQAVEHGVYRVVRHPIYTGVVLLLAGYGLIAGAWWSGLAAGAIAFVYVDRKAAAEERHLRAIHPGYADYCARVPKLVPWPFRRGAPR